MIGQDEEIYRHSQVKTWRSLTLKVVILGANERNYLFIYYELFMISLISVIEVK